MIADIVDVAMRYCEPYRGPFLDGARERVISEATELAGRTQGYKNQVIEAVQLALGHEIEFSSGHPLMGSMFYDMGV
jgi:hypothetical protein